MLLSSLTRVILRQRVRFSDSYEQGLTVTRSNIGQGTPFPKKDCVNFLHLVASSSTRSLPSTPECPGTHLSSTVIPRSYNQFVYSNRLLSRLESDRFGNLHCSLTPWSTLWLSEKIMSRSVSSVSPHAARKASRTAMNSASNEILDPYQSVSKVTDSVQVLDKG